MDIKKFKSVAVAVETYKILKKLAALDDRSAGMQITHLVKQEAKKRKITNDQEYDTIFEKFKGGVERRKS